MKIKCVVCYTTKLVTHVSIVFYNAINTIVCSLDIGSTGILVSIAAGLLVMVSSELVVLLIVCVGINTGSAQQGELATNTHTHTQRYHLIIIFG